MSRRETWVLALLVLHFLGIPWLIFGMVRAGQIHGWLAVAYTGGMGLAFFGSGTPAETVGWVVLGLSLTLVGWSVVRPVDVAARPFAQAWRAWRSEERRPAGQPASSGAASTEICP